MNSAAFPILTTERLTLRQLSIDDYVAIFALRSDPEVNKYLDRQPCNSTEDAINFIKKVNDNIEKSNALYWAITITETKIVVGTICLFDFSTEKTSCEIGYELTTQFQGQGIMTEAVKVIIDYVFQKLEFQSIVAFTHRDNQSSTKILSKFDFINSIQTDNEHSEVAMFTLTNKKVIKHNNQNINHPLF